MSLKAIIEIAVHVESFRNIDLFHQGLYQLRFRIYQNTLEERVFAQPYNIIEAAKQSKTKLLNENVSFIPAHFLDSHSSFVTKTFLIRFCEEEIEINETCLFRTELDAYPTVLDDEIFFECELLFSDINLINNDNKNELTSFKCVSIFKSIVKNIHLGIHEYIPIMFDEDHSALANISFHSILLDFRFRTSPLSSDSVETVHSESIESERPTIVSKIKNNNDSPKNFREFLGKISEQFKTSEIDKFYALYVKALRAVYENSIDFFKILISKCQFEKSKKETLSFIHEPIPILPIPHFMKKKTSYIGLDEKVIQIKYVTNLDYNGKSLDVSKKLKSDKDKEDLANNILTELNIVSGFMLQIWVKYIELLKSCPKPIIKTLKGYYNVKIKERWGESVFCSKIKADDLTSIEARKFENNTIANSMRKKFYLHNIESLNIEDLNMFPKIDMHPIVFEEIYINEKLSKFNIPKKNLNNQNDNKDKEKENGLHIFVMVHGFQGNSFDMRLFKNTLTVAYPDSLFLCSNSNEENTEGDISEMGVNLAREVKSFIIEWCPANSLSKISFIGHSLGGLIIRAALPLLADFENKMFTFLTFSSPHLGYMYNSSSLIDVGMWILKKWRKSISLQQLSMTDAKEIEDTYLYKLSKTPGIGWFKNIVLLSSSQDSYAPFESSRIEKCKETYNDIKRIKYNKMAQNIIENFKTDSLHRIDVNFKIVAKNIDHLIGRAAHIQFLESQALMRMLAYAFDHFFK